MNKDTVHLLFSYKESPGYGEYVLQVEPLTAEGEAETVLDHLMADDKDFLYDDLGGYISKKVTDQNIMKLLTLARLHNVEIVITS